MSNKKRHSELNLEQLFHYSVINRLAHLGKSSMLTSVVIALLVCTVFWNQIDTFLLGCWLAVILTCVVIRAMLIIYFWRMEIEQARLRNWIRTYVLFIYLSAACWGALPFLEIFQTTEWARSFLIFVTAGMSAGGLASLYPLLYASIPYILIIMIPFIVVLAREPELFMITMAVMAGMYCIMLVRSTFVLNRSSNQAIRQDIENKELFKFLKKTRGSELAEFTGDKEWTI